ncbi:MAG: DUF4270 family protein [Bacteroidia bacterium]|nr:DUF4270 domain-containing protein [Bacteroidia bacterium]MDW8135021.1 DUF4270 family protein [Bacteroidia bacterium]
MNKSCTVVTCLLLSTACQNPRRIGEELFPPVSIRTDTLFIINTRQVFLPPPNTLRSPFTFIGETKDSLTGYWQSGWATQFALGGQNVQFYANELVGVDSVILELFIANCFGDISTPLCLKVSRLLQPLSSNTTYLPDASFLVEPENLCLTGKDTLYYSVFSPGARRFSLDTSLGRQILTLPSTALTGDPAFHSAFPGLYIEATPCIPSRNGAVYTILPRSPSTVLRIYYREQIGEQVVPQRYDFFITDSCAWAYRLVRSSISPESFRDQLERDSSRWSTHLLVAGGLPVGIAFQVKGWEKIHRKPILRARLVWPSDSQAKSAYNPLYPRLGSLALYADTTAEIASASWGFGDFVEEKVMWELSQPLQEVAFSRRTPPTWLYIWPPARGYTLQRWVASGVQSSSPPYLIVNSAEP